MISGGELAEHLYASCVTAVAVVVPGCALAPWLPRALRGRHAWAAWPLLGGMYWAVALYGLPFRGGLLLAAMVAVLGAVLSVRSRSSGGWRPPYLLSKAILLLGCLPYLTPVFAQHVPAGMDAARYTLSTRMIAAHAGLPRSLDPVMPLVPFGATNHGVPALAAVAVLAGASPPAALLATVPLTFALLVLSLYGLLRMVLRRTPAAVLAVAVVWLAHQAQQTLGWGGGPGIFALALGFWAARLLSEVLRGKGGSLTAGLCVGALPLLHVGVAAAWLYIAAPVAVAAGLIVSRRKRCGLRDGLAAVAVAGAVVGVYWGVGHPQLSPATAEVFRGGALENIFPENGPALLVAVFRFMCRGLGSTLSLLAAAALLALAWRRAWWALAALLAPLGLTFLVLSNAKYELLPASLLLFPERVRDLPLAVAALALGIAWRVCAPRIEWWRADTARRAERSGASPPASLRCYVAALLLLALALTHHYRFYQKTALRPVFTEDEWQALCWARAHLEPATDFVATMYGTSGAYLPAVAGIPVTRWHAHPVDQVSAAERLAATRRVTHVWLVERAAVLSPIGLRDYDREEQALQALLHDQPSEVVFSSGPVRVYRLPRTPA